VHKIKKMKAGLQGLGFERREHVRC